VDQSLAGLAAMLAGRGTMEGSVFLRLTLVFFSMVAFKKTGGKIYYGVKMMSKETKKVKVAARDLVVSKVSGQGVKRLQVD
jgi:hypothetical protein